MQDDEATGTRTRSFGQRLVVNFESCVELLHRLGFGSCPECDVCCAEATSGCSFRDATIDEEVDIRRRFLTSINNRTIQGSLRDYNDYLEMVRIIFNPPTMIVETNKKISGVQRRQQGKQILRSRIPIRRRVGAGGHCGGEVRDRVTKDQEIQTTRRRLPESGTRRS